MITRIFSVGTLLWAVWAAILLLAACSSDPTTPAGTDAEFELSAVTTVPTATLEREEPKPTAEPESNACLDCHTDKDHLVRTADPVEEVESESSGEG